MYTKTQSVFKLPSVQSNHSCTRKPARLQHFTFLQCSSEFTNIFKLTKFWKCQKFSALKTNLIMKISNRKSQINCTALCTCYLLTSLLTLYSSIHFSWLLLICQHPIIFTTPGRPPSNAPQVRAPGPNTMGQDFFLAFCLQPTQFDLDSTKNQELNSEFGSNKVRKKVCWQGF